MIYSHKWNCLHFNLTYYSNIVYRYCRNNLLNNISLHTLPIYVFRWYLEHWHLKNVSWLDIISDKEWTKRYMYRDANQYTYGWLSAFKFFFRYGHHGQTSFVGAVYFSFILCVCVVCMYSFFPIFLLAIIIWQECTPGIMCVRYGPTQPYFLHKQHFIPGVYSVCFLLCARLAGGDASLRSLCRLGQTILF